MAASSLNEADLVSFSNAAAGHEGVLSDPSGALLIKPCHAAEIAFYETSAAAHPAFAALLPTFIGTLALSTPEQQEGAAHTAEHREAQHAAADALRKHGRPVQSGRAIVLENVTAGFTRPCVLDVKLGARLWDEGAPEAKRRRLDKVAAESTSGSLGFRVAGMRVWRGEGAVKAEGEQGEVKDGYKVFGKIYGRELTEENVTEAFRAFFDSPATSDASVREMVVSCCENEVGVMQEVLEGQESRMYSASILFVYEGDTDAMEKALDALTELQLGEQQKASEADADEDDDDDDDENEPPKIWAAKLIDFAHAEFTPGLGPDENALRGIRSVRKILAQLPTRS